VSSPEAPEQPDPQPGGGRRLIWAGGTVVALWFIADGLSGIWPGAGALGRVLIAVGVVVVVLGVVLGVASVVRGGRKD
jgi:hypothetical protein